MRRALAAREAARIPEPSRQAAVAIILREADPGIEVLFIRRADDPADPWSGQMAFPGGRAEPGDADLRVTAIRETAEEIGLELSSAELLGALDEVQAMARMRPMNLAIAPFVFRIDASVPELTLSSEVRSVHWLPLDELRGTRWRSTTEYVTGDVTLRFPCLNVDGLVIWGLTYRMFGSFDAVLAQPVEASGRQAAG